MKQTSDSARHRSPGVLCKMRGAAAAALAIGVLCGALGLSGCGASAEQSGASAVEPGSAAADTRLDDGVLRQVYSTYEAGTILCGSTPVAHYGEHTTAYLLSDSLTGEARYYVIGAPDGADGFSYTIYDKTGTAVYPCGALAPIALYGDRYVYLVPNDFERYDAPLDVTSPQFVDLSAAEPVPIVLPFDSISDVAMTADGYFAFSQWRYRTLADGSLGSVASVTVTDSNFNLLETFDSCYLANYNFESLDTQHSSFWITHLDAEGMTESQFLYTPSADAYLGALQEVCGKDLVCHEDFERRQPVTGPSTDGLYVVCNLATGEYLARYDRPCVRYANGVALLCGLGEDGSPRYALCEGGEQRPVSEYVMDVSGRAGGFAVVEDSCVAVYAADGSRLYSHPGALHSEYRSESSSSLSLLSNGSLLYEYSENSGYNETDSAPISHDTWTIYNADGMVFQTEDYLSIYQPVDMPYLIGTRAPSNNFWICDILSLDGTVLVSGLSNVGPVPGTELFSARRGFSYGILDTAGVWLWSESVFGTTRDEGSIFY